MERLAGRYELVTEVARGKGRTVWKGHDTVLGRDVGVLMLDRDHPHAEEVREAATAAAQVEDPGLLRVIDADVDDGRVVVITRWLPGSTLADRLATGPLRPGEAAQVVQQVAQALAAAAETGVHHLVLDPRDVVLTDHGPVLFGAGVRAALEGVPAEHDAEAVDAWRLGALLYAALTCRWPGHDCAGLLAAPTVDGRVARPRQVRAGVPTAVDEVVWRCLDPEAPDPLTSPAEVARALRQQDPAAETPAWTDRWSGSGWTVARVGLVAMATLLVAGLVLAGVQVWLGATRPGSSGGPSGASGSTGASASGPGSASSSPGTDGAPIVPVAVTAYDPAGDGQENDSLARLAVDGDPTTAWETVTYASRDLGQLKPGVGLLLDLGAVTDVRGVELELVGRGTDLQVLATDKGRLPRSTTDPTRGMQVIGSVQGAGDQITLRSVKPVAARYVLVWLTGLPVSSHGFQGGIAEVVLLG